MPRAIVLSRFQVKPLFKARQAGEAQTRTSLDLGLSQMPVRLTATGIDLPDGQTLSWADLEEIAENETACYVVEDNTARKIQIFSEEMNRFYSLMPTAGAPTFLISGFPMHRIKDIDPHEDTLRKVKAIAPITGPVLDTVTGLGYTAIEAAHTAERVITVELDPAVIEIARFNPWSQALFDNPKIEQRIGDTFEEIETFPNETFSCIIHDPPTFSLAGDLYSGEYYRQLYRVLRRRGRLFHYIGDLESKSGRNIVSGVIRRLGEAGFSRIVRKPEAFGVACYK